MAESSDNEKPDPMTSEDIAEMRHAAAASVGLFPRIEIDPAHAVELCDLAADAARLREDNERLWAALERRGVRRSVPE